MKKKEGNEKRNREIGRRVAWSKKIVAIRMEGKVYVETESIVSEKIIESSGFRFREWSRSSKSITAGICGSAQVTTWISDEPIVPEVSVSVDSPAGKGSGSSRLSPVTVGRSGVFVPIRVCDWDDIPVHSL